MRGLPDHGVIGNPQQLTRQPVVVVVALHVADGEGEVAARRSVLDHSVVMTRTQTSRGRAEVRHRALTLKVTALRHVAIGRPAGQGGGRRGGRSCNNGQDVSLQDISFHACVMYPLALKQTKTLPRRL